MNGGGGGPRDSAGGGGGYFGGGAALDGGGGGGASYPAPATKWDTTATPLVTITYTTGTLDQQQTEVASEEVIYSEPPFAASRAQTFTAGLTGELEEVELFLAEDGATFPLSVEITTVNGEGKPSATVLSSASVPAASIPPEASGPGAFVPISFAIPASVVAGTKYAIVAYSADHKGYVWGASATNVYAGGAHWESTESPPTTSWRLEEDDLAFRTYVTVAPACSAAPSITEQPEAETVTEPATATFKAAASTPVNCTAPSVQWYSEAPGGSSFSPIGGATSASYTTPATTTAQSGTKYEAVFKNSFSATTSNPATLTVNAAGPPATFGKTSVGASSESDPANLKGVNRYALPTAGSVSKLSVYLQPTGSSGQQSFEGVIYADSSGAPGALLGTSNPLVFKSSNSAGWYDLTFPTPLKLAAGNYWIGFISANTANVAAFRYDTLTKALDYNANTYTSGPSNPFGSPTITSQQISLYATYTAS